MEASTEPVTIMGELAFVRMCNCVQVRVQCMHGLVHPYKHINFLEHGSVVDLALHQGL